MFFNTCSERLATRYILATDGSEASEHAVEHADDTDADAIYVGHRVLTEQRESAVGRVAKSVVDKVTVPVTVIR